jgi:N-dimethylarginine dimethylaminohydrolase
VSGDAQRWILMGDPTHFSVKGGANPHTRTKWGTKRSVDRERAIEQWHHLKGVLMELGLHVLVVPPIPDWPGSVYPANAGVMWDVDEPKPVSEKRFLLADLLPTRAGEKPHYQRVLNEAGIATESLDPGMRFEGEADFFPAAGHYILTHGQLEKQRFVLRFGIPPWKRVYGFRTDVRMQDILPERVAPNPVLRVELCLEAHYHGDTALCAFGPKREHLLVYKDAISPADWPRVVETFGDALIELGSEDAQRYAANSFTYTQPDASNSYLVMPGGVSERLQGQIRERGVTPVVVDVSEFLKKGGGSVKCMIGDLGIVLSEART